MGSYATVERCSRCTEHALYQETHRNGTIIEVCQKCGYTYMRELTDQYWEDARLNRIDPTIDYSVTHTEYAPGTFAFTFKTGGGTNGVLPWSDPHGDEFRAWLRQHNEAHPASHPKHITKARITTYNAYTRQWEALHLEQAPKPERELQEV